MPQRYEMACTLLPRRLREAALAVPEKEKVEELRLRQGERLTLTLPEGEVPDHRGGSGDGSGHRHRLLPVYGRPIPAAGISHGGGGISHRRVRHSGGGGGAGVVLPGPVLPEYPHPPGTDRAGGPGAAGPAVWRTAGEHPGHLPARRRKDDFAAHDLRRSAGQQRLAAIHRGVPQLQVGRHTDILDACPKALAIPTLLRAMNPQVIAVDEVAVAGDVAALEQAAGAGVVLLATVHGAGVEDLARKPLLAGMLGLGLFRKAVRIGRLGEGRWYAVEELP